MNKFFVLASFILMVLAQCFVPTKMILDQEAALSDGVAYKFRTMPIDPNDPLRGKYVYLRYQVNKATIQGDTLIKWDDPVYVYLTRDAEGFATATGVSKTKLNINQDYVLATANYRHSDTLEFDLPFTRFYMEESKAYPAELLLRQANRDSLLNNCYALVYIKDDTAVLDNVFVNDQPIKEYVEMTLQKNASE